MRCSLREPHPAHSYTTRGDGRRCDGSMNETPGRPVSILRHVVPLDGRGRRAYLWLPEDMTETEMQRLTAMVVTLPL